MECQFILVIGKFLNKNCRTQTPCCGNPAALGLQARSFYLLRQITARVDIGVGQPIPLVLGLGICRVGQPGSCPLSSGPGNCVHYLQ